MTHYLEAHLDLDQYPHCGVSSPYMHRGQMLKTTSKATGHDRMWAFYVCSRCGGVVSAAAEDDGYAIEEMFPTASSAEAALPERARDYLNQAYASLHAPAGATMLAASAVDAMLKDKGYKEGTLYSRIDSAVTDHLITDGMGAWAHKVRLDANGQRHADLDFDLPTPVEARSTVEFAAALGHFLYTLPARIEENIHRLQA